ncbi:MAG: hypothetical protein KatS3mg111_0831 [Pirellulaceae bacterium]|nr:MAG: hypothetical protein KatS3mg111_0831 [Pirellulaceae bacterium]
MRSNLGSTPRPTAKYGAIAATLTLVQTSVIATYQVATIGHRWPGWWSPAVIAWAVMTISMLPPLGILPRIHAAPAAYLLIPTWRMLVLLGAVLIADWWPGEPRNHFFALLMACYFVVLPLESWLLIRQIRRVHPPSGRSPGQES